MSYVLEIENLRVDLFKDKRFYNVLDDISIKIKKSKITAIVGESGSGKTVTFLSVMKLLPDDFLVRSGKILFGSINLLDLSEEEMIKLRGKDIAFIFQEPMTALNPVVNIEKQMAEILTQHKICDYNKAVEISKKALYEVGIDPSKIRSYPHNFSGGQIQRILIAMSFLADPKIIIADEPTTSLDVVTQIDILNLIRELTIRQSISVVLISHNISVVYNFSDYIYVMYLGQIVEEGETKKVIKNPKHPYTISLLNSIVKLGSKERIKPIEGVPPDLTKWSSGCRFYGRCPYGIEKCLEKPPKKESDAGSYYCWVK